MTLGYPESGDVNLNMATLLADVARRIPDKIAVTDARRDIRFGELAARASRMAGAMRDRFGMEPGDRVLLYLDNCAEFFEIIYAAWTAGLCIVPVNAKLHEREVLHILQNSGARLCFVSADKKARLLPLLRDISDLKEIIAVQDSAYDDLDRGDPIPIQDVNPVDPAWIFYTSGTTGKPKGAILSFRSLLFMTQCYYSDIDTPGPGDTKLHAAPLSHGSGLYSLAHIFRGGRQIVLSGFDPSEVFSRIADNPNVSIFAAPTMVSRLLDAPEAETADRANLRVLYFGGGPMYQSELRRALRLFGPRLYHLYGQGESPMTITGFRPRPDDEGRSLNGNDRLTSCGYCRTGVEIRIADEDGRTLPAGAIGEVLTRSDCLMSGYWQDPGATAKALRDGWLWTGDIGTCDDEGFLYLKDRSKDLIISGGTNVYPREIEDVLLTHPDLLECSVVGRPHPEWGEEVVAFVVTKPGRRFDHAALDQHLTAQIARFKRPKAYRVLDHLPKNNYGKVLKNDLRDLLRQELE